MANEKTSRDLIGLLTCHGVNAPKQQTARFQSQDLGTPQKLSSKSTNKTKQSSSKIAAVMRESLPCYYEDALWRWAYSDWVKRYRSCVCWCTWGTRGALIWCNLRLLFYMALRGALLFRLLYGELRSTVPGVPKVVLLTSTWPRLLSEIAKGNCMT